MNLVHMMPESVVPLANAIIANTARDYMQAIVRNNSEEQKNCESFFSSEWFDALCYGMDGNSLANNIRKKSEKFAAEVDKHQPQQWGSEEEADRCSFRCTFCGYPVTVEYASGAHVRGYQKDDRIVRHHCDKCLFEVLSEYGVGRILEPKCENCELCMNISGKLWCTKRHGLMRGADSCNMWSRKNEIGKQ